MSRGGGLVEADEPLALGFNPSTVFAGSFSKGSTSSSAFFAVRLTLHLPATAPSKARGRGGLHVGQRRSWEVEELPAVHGLERRDRRFG